MPKKFNVVYLPIAQNDLIEIFDYIQEDDPSAAAEFISKIDKSISKLGSYPKMGVAPKDERLRMLGYRILVIQNYLVFYIIRGNTVEIRRVIHGSRRYSFLL